MNLFQGQFLSVVPTEREGEESVMLCFFYFYFIFFTYEHMAEVFSPVAVIQVLAYERVRPHRSVAVDSWHVHVVYEVDHPPVAHGGVVPASSFL